MKGRSLCMLVFYVCWAAGAVDASPVDRCRLPHGLDAKIAENFLGAHVVRLSDLEDYDKKLFIKDHGAHCPGLVKLDFYGDGKPTWAIVLVSGRDKTSKAELIVARQV